MAYKLFHFCFSSCGKNSHWKVLTLPRSQCLHAVQNRTSIVLWCDKMASCVVVVWEGMFYYVQSAV